MTTLHYVYQKNFYNDKQDIIDDMFYQYHLILMKDIDHPELIQEQEQNIYSDAYEINIDKEIKLS